ncbi:unnamed protein product [Allacma fusca]|uniref:Uncharacterized protein n=1 Tax=Allacma fusca TaxID=39272 RepID=A0A8J2KEW6_9HEXA|nr:unnamed protein product [Allacma fusca]
MEKVKDKLRDREKHERFRKEKSKSPLSVDELTNNSSCMSSVAGKSPDVNISHRIIGNGSSSPASTNSAVVTSSKTKNIGVGANLNGSSIARQLRLSSSSGQSGNGSRTVPVPTSLSPNTSSILPEMIQQSQLGRSVPMMVGTSRNSHSPGLPLSKSSSSELPAIPASAVNRMVSQNINGTLAVTGVPTNDSELQLYRVLQRANLLSYFDVMIELGGDDVQQLCDAGEEEFLEIMALVGMASKPLHVRRLQKSLQEWMTQPGLFQIPILNSHLPPFGQPGSTTPLTVEGSSSQIPIRPIPFHSAGGGSPQFLNPTELMKNLQSKLSSLRGNTGSETHGSNSSSPIGNLVPTPVISLSSSNYSSSQISTTNNINGQSNGGSGLSLSLNGNSISSDQIIPSHFLEQRIRTRSEASSPASSNESHQLDSRTSLSPIPFLQDHEIQRLSETAVHVIAGLPSSMMEPRLSAKKKMCAEYEAVMRLPENDPARMEVVRKFAAIYGRHDCKRKVQKPLTLHELTVNEASAQLCVRLPALLTRRDELFPLARQVVKDAGLPYASVTSNLSISFLPKTIRHEDSLKLGSHSNVNGSVITSHYNHSGERVSKRMRLNDSKGDEAQDLRSSFSNDNESNSEDSPYSSDIISASTLSRSSSSRRYHEELFAAVEKSKGVLDMSSHSDEPNDLTITKTMSTSKCNLSSNNNVRTSLHNIKSEPVMSAFILIIWADGSASERYGKVQRKVIREINQNKSPVDKSLWSNEGFQESNAAGGVKLNVSTHFLMGTNSAKLHTTLSEFNGKFLFIKFSSMIGKSIPVTKPSTTPSTTTTATTTTPTTTTTTSSTTTTTTTSTTTTTTTTKPSILETKMPLTIPDINQEDPLEESRKLLEPGQIIEIALDSNDHGSFQINSAPEENDKSTKRKRRELNSQEISQVHRIISEAANKKEDTKPVVPKSDNVPKSPPEKVISVPTIMEAAITFPALQIQKAVVSGGAVPSVILDPNQQYKTWKASLSQSFRPSGFYVLVDDHVVYDNWEGVWDLQKPNVLGKHVKNSASDIWCHTEILLEWDDPPQKDIKIRFEWDPPTPSSYLFLGNITISTIDVETKSRPQPPYATEILNKNITLYIVVKQPELLKVVTVPPPPVKTVEPPVTTPTTTVTTRKATSTTTISTVGTTTSKNVPTTNKTTMSPAEILLQRVVSATSNDGNAKHNSSTSTPFIVVTALGLISFFIMIVLMHTKFKENQRLRGSYC